MNEPTTHETLTSLQNAEFSAYRVTALPYRDCSAWSVTPGGGMTQLTAEEAYLIAQSLQPEVQPSK